MSDSVRFFLLLIVVSALAAAAGYYLGRPRSAPPAPPEAVPTAEAPVRLMALTLPDLAGKPQALAQWRGKVLVVNFWATWCPPCKEEMPEFSRISSKYTENGVKFVGISIDSAENVSAFQKQTPVSYPLLIGTPETLDLTMDFGNRAKGLPFTVVLRPDGRTQHVKLGKLATADLEKAIRAALRPD